MLFWDPMVQENQPPFHVNRFEKPTQGQIRYAPNTKIGVVFQASVLDEMLTLGKSHDSCSTV